MTLREEAVQKYASSRGRYPIFTTITAFGNNSCGDTIRDFNNLEDMHG